jgi:hypothetical protein
MSAGNDADEEYEFFKLEIISTVQPLSYVDDRHFFVNDAR